MAWQEPICTQATAAPLAGDASVLVSKQIVGLLLEGRRRRLRTAGRIEAGMAGLSNFITDGASESSARSRNFESMDSVS